MGDVGRMRVSRQIALIFSLAVCAGGFGSELAAPSHAFLERYCFECHDADSAKGGLDLTALKFDTSDPKVFSKWVKVHDRVRDGEMPPKKKSRPDTVAV